MGAVRRAEHHFSSIPTHSHSNASPSEAMSGQQPRKTNLHGLKLKDSNVAIDSTLKLNNFQTLTNASSDEKHDVVRTNYNDGSNVSMNNFTAHAISDAIQSTSREFLDQTNQAAWNPNTFAKPNIAAQTALPELNTSVKRTAPINPVAPQMQSEFQPPEGVTLSQCLFSPTPQGDTVFHVGGYNFYATRSRIIPQSTVLRQMLITDRNRVAVENVPSEVFARLITYLDSGHVDPGQHLEQLKQLAEMFGVAGLVLRCNQLESMDTDDDSML